MNETMGRAKVTQLRSDHYEVVFVKANNYKKNPP